ncbi:ThuA domain-containing protein [Frankia sp. Cas3]|uniref:ThuA domain-containing protein n=1 Tax=Frankia sp. Cas3 TaxID=3073926 RepID=UPI002AD25085|nr:ThuA domain-containing protein [Frankia sp. Cas3]
MAGPAGRIDAVLVCGGRWHDFDFARLQLLERLGRHERVRTRVFEDYARTDAIGSADLLVTYTCDRRPSAEQQQVLVDFVARGGRWLALHGTNSAIDAPASGMPRLFTTPRVLGEAATVLGSQFLGHPPIAPYQVEITQADHPLVVGIDPFEVSDELYVSELHPPLDVLLHTRYRGPCRGFTEGHVADSADDVQPVLYLRRHGDGEVCYFTLGHCRGRFDVQDLGVDDLGRTDRGSWTAPEFATVLDRCLSRAIYGAR